MTVTFPTIFVSPLQTPRPDLKFFQPGDVVQDLNAEQIENHITGVLLDDGNKVTVLNPDKAFDWYFFTVNGGGSGDVAWQYSSAYIGTF